MTSEIKVLDSETIDKIAAGEVVERPASVVKELVENAIDAGANAISVEIRDGGIGLIRVTDNGSGIEKNQIPKAFLRHSTSKIDTAEDLSRLTSLGFRGEALSSIAAVAQVEMITKTEKSLTGARYCIEGGVQKEFQEIGAPEGTTFVVRNLFYNVPVRKKFLKQAPTEGGYVSDLMEHLALSRPDVSFRFMMGTQMKFHTSGNGDLKEVIYRIYGREIANALVPIQTMENGMKTEGYLGKPILVRSNRNFEICFVNGRFIRSSILSKAVEEGYREYLMQHKFPFCVLHFSLDPEFVDANVHPTKMDVRFSDNIMVTEFISKSVKNALVSKEMIPEERMDPRSASIQAEKNWREETRKVHVAEPFEKSRKAVDEVAEESAYGTKALTPEHFQKSPVWERVKSGETAKRETNNAAPLAKEKVDLFFEETIEEPQAKNVEPQTQSKEPEIKREEPQIKIEEPENLNADETVKPKQLDLFEEKILAQNNRALYQIIGQVFDTYWMFQYQDKLCILDQHAAHEKVKYERLMKRFREKEVLSQTLFPPVILTLSAQEELILKEYQDVFTRLGFEVESFGGREYALRSVPVDLYGCSEREMFLSVLDELESGVTRLSPTVVEEKIASMSCKAAVKGNNRLSREEADRLIDELLTLENPYNCPHGRPTIITISKYEMEKKFKRIVN